METGRLEVALHIGAPANGPWGGCRDKIWRAVPRAIGYLDHASKLAGGGANARTAAAQAYEHVPCTPLHDDTAPRAAFERSRIEPDRDGRADTLALARVLWSIGRLRSGGSRRRWPRGRSRRSRACGSWNWRASSPGRGRANCWPISARPSSRSSGRARVTTPVIGAPPSWRMPRAAVATPPISTRPTAASAPSRSTSKVTTGRRSCAGSPPTRTC